MINMFSDIAQKNAKEEVKCEAFRSVRDLPMINQDDTILFAILVQNSLHPKNAQRVASVNEESYKEILTHSQAVEYLGDILKLHLTHELSAIESQIQVQFNKLEKQEDVRLILEAPDAIMGAAVLTTQPFYIGKGDRSTFIEIVLNSDPHKIKDLGNKLMLLTKNEFGGFKVYNDKLSSFEHFGKQTVYKLWMHCVRKFKALNLE